MRVYIKNRVPVGQACARCKVMIVSRPIAQQEVPKHVHFQKMHLVRLEKHIVSKNCDTT